MNIIIKTALTGAIKALIGAEWWNKVREAVNKISDANISGEEKRANVILALREMGWGMAGWLLNLAIEIAVALLMSVEKKS